jgi:tripartite-type tricarboxylate transporter receptor subunit TctC
MRPNIKRIFFTINLCFLVNYIFVQNGQAENYPIKPVRIIVGFTAGGPSDIVARLLSHQLTTRLKQSFFVENKVGAAGTIGAKYVANSPPDGYTLYLASQTSHAVSPYLLSSAGFDPSTDVTTVIRVVHNPLLMVVNSSSPFRTLSDIIKYAKENPKNLNFATGGIGSSPHMSMELFQKSAEISMTSIHYKGDGAAIIDIVSGQVDLLTSSISALMPHVESGKLRPITITGKARSQVLPNTPTIAELGYPNYEVLTWFGIVGPAKIPKEVVNILNKEISNLLDDPKFKTQLLKMGFEIIPNSPEEFSQFLNEETLKWKTLIRSLNLKAN